MTKLLVFGYGNPGRGDDMLGPKLVERIEALGLEQVCCQNDMQLQIEHVTDLDAHDQVLFIDADCSCYPPYKYSRVLPVKDNSYSTHAMTPAALLYLYTQHFRTAPPKVFLLQIRGYRFDLGATLSAGAAANLEIASQWAIQACKARNLETATPAAIPPAREHHA
ncbi:hydrogenase maturation protease [Nitrosomonas sp. ANs5]|uniref:hydrogenase maturation protease n=1 Tax=Nitrosomonas sp. ANs5 TaxID=3423941 RepID=UPI003D327DA2